MDIVALQETRWPPAERISTKDYFIYYRGCDDDRYYGGIGFAVIKRIAEPVICFEIWSKTMCNIADIFLAPTEESHEEDANAKLGMRSCGERLHEGKAYIMKETGNVLQVCNRSGVQDSQRITYIKKHG